MNSECTLAAPNSKQPAYVRWSDCSDGERGREVAELKLIGNKGGLTGKGSPRRKISLIYRNQREWGKWSITKKEILGEY